LTHKGAAKPHEVSAAVEVQQAARAQASSAAESSIRVDVGLLRNQIVQFANSTDDSELLGTSQRLNLITTELQESVMKTRMQPIGNVWSKFPRTVRDVAVGFGKQVHVEMEGRETELDARPCA
jgi:two-component system chemotaxis sensor kinase CheA